jgi:hypothetical protein
MGNIVMLRAQMNLLDSIFNPFPGPKARFPFGDFFPRTDKK